MTPTREKDPPFDSQIGYFFAISVSAIFISPIGATGMKIILGLVPTITFPLVVPLEAFYPSSELFRLGFF